MKLSSLRRNSEGATAIEYGVIAALIGLGLVAALTNTRGSLNKDLNCIATGVGTQGASGCTSTPPTPTTAMGYAVQMVPAGRSIYGVTSNNSGTPYNWYSYSGDPTQVGTQTSLVVTTDPSYHQSYYLAATVVKPNVYIVTSYGGAPVQVQPGTTTYGVVTPQGWILVDTVASAQ